MELPVPSSDGVFGSRDMVGILRSAVQHLQSEIDRCFLLQGAVHTPSWKFPSACAAELDVESVLDRYAFVGASQQHILVARMALLELVVDRVSLLSETTCRHVDAYAQASEDNDHSTCYIGTDSTNHSDQTGAGDTIAEHISDGGGMLALTRLCRLTRRLRDDIASLEIRLINKDDALDRRDEEIERLVALLDVADGVQGIAEPSAPDAGSAVSTATPGTPIRDTCVASVQTQPELDDMDDMSRQQQLPCVDCASLRSGIAAIASAIEDCKLDGREEFLADKPGTSPFLCTRLTVRYLQAHRQRIDHMAAVLRNTERDRDQGLQDLASARTLARDLEAQLRAQSDAAVRQVAVHAAEVAEMKTTCAADMQHAADQHFAAVQEVGLQHERAVAVLRNEQRVALHVAQRQGAAKVAEISRELVAATDAHVATEGTLRATRLENSRLETQVVQLRQQLEQTAAMEAQSAGTCTQLQSEVDLLRQRADTAEDRAHGATQRVKELETALASVRASEEKTAHELAAVAASCSEQATTLNTMREELKTAKTDASEWQQKCIATEARLAESETWLDKAAEERRRLLLELNRLRGLPGDTAPDSRKVQGVTPRPPSGTPSSPLSTRRSSGVSSPRLSSAHRRPSTLVADTPAPAGETSANVLPVRNSAVTTESPVMSRAERQAMIKQYLASREE